MIRLFTLSKEHGVSFTELIDRWTCEQVNAASLILQEDRMREARMMREQNRSKTERDNNIRPMTFTDFMAMQPKKPKNMKG